MESVVEGRWPWPGEEITSEGSEDDSSDVDGPSGERCDSGGDIDVEGDGDPRPRPNWGLGMNVDVDVDVDIEMDSSIQVERRTRRVRKSKVRRKKKVEDVMPVDGGRNATAAASSSLKPKAKKAVDLGPLVGAKRGFRTREKVPMNGGWGGVEVVPSSLKPFPEVQAGDPHVGDKGKGKARVAEGE